MLDMHCHILPGVDDGAKIMKETEEMLKMAVKCGIDRIIATPHVYHADQDLTAVYSAFSEVKEKAAGCGVALKLGFEVNWRVLTEIPVDALDRYCVQGTNAVLLELPGRNPMPDWEDLLAKMRDRYKTVIVHPERFLYVQKKIEYVEDMMGYGCEIAVDASGLYGRILSEERKTAKQLIKRGMVHYLASDAHYVSDYRYVEKAKSQMEELCEGSLYDKKYWT